jgi:carboxymethylenebutenolidase
MWNSFATDSSVGVHAEITNVPGGEADSIHAYVARPTADLGPRGGVVLLHHMPGWDEFYFETAERIGRHGYDVVVPDLYCRYGHGGADDMSALVRSKGGIPDASVMGDCAAARDWLKALPTSNGKVAVMGSCSGGRHTVLAVSMLHGFVCGIDCWGGGVVVSDSGQLTAERPIAPIDLTADLDAPILGLFGNDDPSPSPEEVDLHEETLIKHGKAYEFHRYDGAPHAYFCYDRFRYRHEAAMESWEHIFRFFHEYLD